MTCSVKSLAPMTMWEERGGAQAVSGEERDGSARVMSALHASADLEAFFEEAESAVGGEG